MSNRIGIKTVPLGKQFIGFCILRKKELRYKANGEAYLHLELGDWSGRLNAKIWNSVKKYDEMVEVGKIVKIKAVVQQFQDRKELKIQQLRKSQPGDEIDLHLLLPRSQKDIVKLKESFFEHISRFQNPHLQKLLSNIFSNEQDAEQFFMSPAGKLWHHNYLYGMLEHVVTMLDIVDVMKRHYPLIDADLLKCGIILHDIGKTKGYDKDGFIDYSDEGRLIGHITIGYDSVSERINEFDDFPPELRKQLLHMILSHQGAQGKGSPVEPQTIEAIVLHYINELDSKANAVTRIIESDMLPDSKWSKFIPSLERFVYYNEAERTELDQEDEEKAGS